MNWSTVAPWDYGIERSLNFPLCLQAHGCIHLPWPMLILDYTPLQCFSFQDRCRIQNFIHAPYRRTYSFSFMSQCGTEEVNAGYQVAWLHLLSAPHSHISDNVHTGGFVQQTPQDYGHREACPYGVFVARFYAVPSYGNDSKVAYAWPA